MYISRLELEKSQEIARSLDFNEVEKTLHEAEADCATALNIAGMKALKEIGRNPVITPSVGYASEVAQLRVKEIIHDEFCVYLTGHYLDSMFSNGRYAINVVLTNETPIVSPDAITLETQTMQLNRTSLPFIGPSSTLNHSTYWVASVPLTFDICTLNNNKWERVATRTVVVSSILTSRYLLLESLMEEYERTINGTFSPLWTFSTAFSNLYSLIRGLKHYYQGKPLNVVDNHHLAVILNSGLLLEQGLVFSSVDPLGVVELARQIQQVLRQTPQDSLTTLNEEMNGDGYPMNADVFDKGSANVDANCPLNASFDDSLSVNFSEIAEHILYNITGVTLYFENTAGETAEEYLVFDEEIQARIHETVMRWANQSFFNTCVKKHLMINGTAMRVLQEIIAEVYQDIMATQVADRHVAVELWGDPGDGWTNDGASIWESTDVHQSSTQLIQPAKGFITPGCALYQERYNVSYQRTHFWWRFEEHIINGTQVIIKVWNNVTDHLTEIVTLHVVLQHYARYQDSQDDIVDVLYYNLTVDDPNLDDTLEAYLTSYPDVNPEKHQLLVTQNNQGDVGLEAVVPGSFPSWVLQEAWDDLKDILDDIRQYALDPSLNATNYPNPVMLINATKERFLTQFQQHATQYLNLSAYHPGSDFLSVGKKAVYYTRDWFVHNVINETDAVYDSLCRQLMDALQDAIPDNAGFRSEDITKTLDDTADAVRNQCTIPFGCEMMLTAHDPGGAVLWNESVRLAVDQYPNYLDPFVKTKYDGEEFWTLKLRNRCILGPTGLMILPPSPVTPWLVTMNVWVIDVEGQYAQLKIIDSSDETVFNPLLGHEPQVYIREAKVVTVANVTLGENTRVTFGFTTVAFGVVPPWGMMIGDLQDNWFDEHTPGFEEDN